jgi:hypothetical protein
VLLDGSRHCAGRARILERPRRPARKDLNGRPAALEFFVIPGGAEGARGVTLRQCFGISRLRSE